MSTLEPPTIDREVLEGLRDEFGTPTLVSLAGLFCERAPLVADVLRVSSGSDGDELARLAESLRGASSIIAAARLAELCKELAERGRSGSMYGAEILAREIMDEFERAKRELSRALG